MDKLKVTSVGTNRFNSGTYGIHQVCALLIALEHSSGEMESGDITAAIAGINSLVRDISMDMDQALLEGGNDD
ncbi:hypothetical protein GC087_02475 [Pantoea sp. JZ2]|uniref:hypothetical protein n=1 Tax=Pantoea sp. JZ2 TaxID=2654189 RepID=UPI002B495C61|nr:hypothetical protein [Pantoea sp. JZ2]WRH11568.1 hypothetical protein GC087_02475 [Pantoea sp. JZ2]